MAVVEIASRVVFWLMCVPAMVLIGCVMAFTHIVFRKFEEIVKVWWIIWPVYFVIAVFFVGLLAGGALIIQEVWDYLAIETSRREKGITLIADWLVILVAYFGVVYKMTGRFE